MPHAPTPDGASLHHTLHGHGEPLLLINGQGLDHTMWDGLRDDLADAPFQLIAYDLRGTGESTWPDPPRSHGRSAPLGTREFARDAIALLDHLGIQRAHVYGFSLGGRIAQWLAAEHPERVGSLILGATTPGNKHGVPRPDSVSVTLSRGDHRSLDDLMTHPNWRAAHPELAQLPPARIPAAIMRRYFEASEAHDSWDALPRIQAPTLVLHGDADRVNMTSNATVLAQRIPGAEKHLIAKARHAYFRDHRAEASRVVKDFLLRHPLPPTEAAPVTP